MPHKRKSNILFKTNKSNSYQLLLTRNIKYQNPLKIVINFKSTTLSQLLFEINIIMSYFYLSYIQSGIKNKHLAQFFYINQ